VALGLIITGTLLVQAVTLAATLAALFAHHWSGVRAPAFTFAIATAVKALATGLSEPVLTHVAAPSRRALRHRALEYVLAVGSPHGVDATVQLATRGMEAIEFYLATYLPALILGVLAPVVVLAWLALHDWWSFAIVTLCLALLPVFMVLLGLAARDSMHERWAQQQRLAGYFGDVLRGMGVLKSFNRDTEAVANLDEVGTSLVRATMRTLKVAFASSFALELLSSLATALVAVVLGLRLIEGRLGLNVALAVLLVTPEAFLPLRRSAAQFHASSDGIAAATAMLDAFDHTPARGSAPAPIVPPRLAVTGPDGHCHEVAAGGVMVLEGPSGAGKTTMLRAVAGLGGLDRAAIMVDGTDLHELALDAWRSVVGYVAQDPHLPGTTVRDVVCANAPEASDSDVREALKLVGLSVDLERPVGEDGAGFSAGQRRRLALARALVRRPLVLLLDEPLAHLDEASAAAIAQLISTLPQTRVIATHRLMAGDVLVHLEGAVRA
jgi:ABC-type transport system involved in cytochrome bd biosynthesis fused ATPase/permease subunit